MVRRMGKSPMPPRQAPNRNRVRTPISGVLVILLSYGEREEEGGKVPIAKTAHFYQLVSGSSS